jgi:putative ABC transport system substrate-binding protein
MQFPRVKRREFITLLGAAAAAWPFAARAQQGKRVRRIGVLILYAKTDPAGQLRAEAFRHELEKLGWAIGRNLEIDFHWGKGDAAWVQSAAEQLVKLAPDLILANTDVAVGPLQQATRTIPIVFVGPADPVAEGFVQSLAHPGGNITGFSFYEPSVGQKLLGVLKEIAPRVHHIAIMRNPASPSARLYYSAAAAAARQYGVEITDIEVRESAEIEPAIAQLGREPDRGLIVIPDAVITGYRKLIVELAARHRLPTVYGVRAFADDGGLISYSVDLRDLFRQAAGYADRILKGEKAGDLPVQFPTKFELAINLKAAAGLGIVVPPTLLATADALIE